MAIAAFCLLSPFPIQGADEVVPEDTCVVELNLPEGSTVEVDGTDHGTQREFEYQPVEPNGFHSHTYKLRFPSGLEEEHKIRVCGGRKVRLARRDPSHQLPELVVPSVTAGCGTPSLQFFSDESKVLSYEGNAALYDIITGRLLRSFRPNDFLATPNTPDPGATVFLSDDTQLMMGADIWDVTTGRKLHDLGDTGSPDFAKPSPNGKYIMTCADGEGILWDSALQRRLRTFETTRLGTGWDSVAFSPDEQQLLLPLDRSMVLYDVATGRQLKVFEASHAAFSKNGLRILTSSPTWGHNGPSVTEKYPPVATLWDAATLETLQTFDCRLMCPSLSPDGSKVLTDSDDGKAAVLWDASKRQVLRTFDMDQRTLRSAVLSPDANTLLTTADGDNSATLWDASTGEQLHTFRGSRLSGWCDASFSPSGAYIVTSDLFGCSVWDSFSHRLAVSLPRLMPLYWVGCISSRGGLIAYETQMCRPYGEGAVLWDMNRLTCTNLPGAGTPLGFSEDGQLLLTLSDGDDSTINIWDTQRKVIVRSLGGHPGGVRDVCFSPEGRRVLSCSRDTAILWDVATGQQQRTFEGHDHIVESVSFSPDGSKVITGVPQGPFMDDPGSITLWDTASGQQLHTFPDQEWGAFSADGQSVLTCSKEGSGILWDAGSGQRKQELDGQSILTSSTEESVVLWDAGSGKRKQEVVTISADLHPWAVNCPGDNRIATTSNKAIVQLWDTSTGKETARFADHFGVILDVQADPEAGLLITSAYDDRVVYRDLYTGSHVLTLTFTSGGVVITTPDGLFDGSPKAIEDICYRIGDGLNVVPVERFFQDYYYPGLFAAIMRGERPLPDIEIGKKLPPTIKLVSPGHGETTDNIAVVDALIEDQGGGIKLPWVSQNGTRMVVDSKPVREGENLRWKFELPLIDGVNRIEVQSASVDGSWESEPAAVSLSYSPATATKETELYLLAIGVSRYADESVNLQYAGADAEAFAELFRTRGKNCYGQDRVHVQTLIDDEATSENIEGAIEQIAQAARPQDVFLMTLSGHGVMVGQRYFFLPHEFTTKDEGGWEEDAKKHGLPGDVLQTWINQVPALKRVVVYDTCQSGGAVGVAGLSRNPFEFQRAFETFRRSTGCHVIAAATASQNAEEIHDLGHGALSYALLAGLGAVDRGPLKSRPIEANDGLVQVRDWLSYAQDNVPALTKLFYGREQLVDVFAKGQSFPILGVSRGQP